MTETELLVRNVSDTALWVAHYRALETERPDGLFRDPLAKRLAGERGPQIAASQPFMHQHAWSLTGRTLLFDRYIEQAIASGADVIVNLAAGLDTRPYRLKLPGSLLWIEVDLPPILAYKEKILATERPRCQLERVALDLTDQPARQALFAAIAARGRRVLVLSEGLLIYLATEEVAALARDLAAPPSFQRWVMDLASPGLLRMMQSAPGSQHVHSVAPYQFGPQEGPKFFEPYGWKLLEYETPLKLASRHKRLPSLMMRFFALLPQTPPKDPKRPWSAVCVFVHRLLA